MVIVMHPANIRPSSGRRDEKGRTTREKEDVGAGPAERETRPTPPASPEKEVPDVHFPT